MAPTDEHWNDARARSHSSFLLNVYLCVCCTSAFLMTVSNTSGSSSGRNRWVVIIKLAARPQTFSSLSYLAPLVAHVFFFFWSILVHSSNDGVLHSHITITPASIIIFIPVPSYTQSNYRFHGNNDGKKNSFCLSPLFPLSSLPAILLIRRP